MVSIPLDNIKNDPYFQEILGLEKGEPFSLLGQGEYNINYSFYSSVYEQNLVLRIAAASQMHLKRQIRYEYEALRLLEPSGVTPKPLYCDDQKVLIPYGFLVMEYLPGHPLDYQRDLPIPAEVLAKVHSTELPSGHHLITPKDPLRAIYEECLQMFAVYENSSHRDPKTTKRILDLLDIGTRIGAYDVGHRCLINTELNSGNFLINGRRHKNYLVDWEKPLYGYPAQDLGHFLAPTTTFFKTDDILTHDQIQSFLGEYCKHSNQCKDPRELWSSVKSYLSMNCLRGITWCAMAYIQYQDPNKLIANAHTYQKIKAYLSLDFLDLIQREFLDGY